MARLHHNHSGRHLACHWIDNVDTCVHDYNREGVRMSNKYNVEYTDTFGGEANYSWVKRATVSMPELTHYGYDGSTNYSKANKTFGRELMKRAKAAVGITGVRGKTFRHGDMYEFRPHNSCTVMFVSYADE
jgi:hypothetical protein